MLIKLLVEYKQIINNYKKSIRKLNLYQNQKFQYDISNKIIKIII